MWPRRHLKAPISYHGSSLFIGTHWDCPLRCTLRALSPSFTALSFSSNSFASGNSRGEEEEWPCPDLSPSCSLSSSPFPLSKKWPWLPTDMAAITMTTRSVTDLEVSKPTSARHSAVGGAARRSTTSRACSSAKSAAGSASASHRATTATRPSALATTTGRPRREAPSALEFNSSVFRSPNNE